RSLAAGLSAWTPGRNSANRRSLFARNGRCCGKLVIAACSAGGPPVIVCSICGVTWLSALNVVSRSWKRFACVCATGATIDAVREPVRRRALGDLDVLEPERRARTDQDRRVHRQRAHRRLQLDVELGGVPAMLQGERLDLVDDTDARAADAHLVALDQVGRAG